MAAHQVQLQRIEIIPRDMYFGKFAESRVNAIHDAAFCYDAIDNGARSCDTLSRSRAQANSQPPRSYGGNLLNRKWLSGKI
jgi:hypothetical protein